MRIIWINRVHVDVKSHITTWRETYKYLSEKHEIHYIFPYERAKDGFCDRITYVKTIKVPYLRRLIYVVMAFYEFTRLTKKVKADMVILDVWTFFFSVIYVFRGAKPKFVLDLRTPEYGANGNKIGFMDRALRWYTRFALKYNRAYHDGITYISVAMREEFKKLTKSSLHDNWVVWSSGVDPDLFVSRRRKNRNAGSNIPFRVFFHGAVTQNRGLREVIEAVDMLNCANVCVELHIVGEGPYLNQLKVVASQIRYKHRVCFYGFDDYKNIPSRIEEADLCVMAYPKLPYWEANVPIKILEYMAMCKPILCTRLKIFEEITESGKFVVFIGDNSPEQIARGIKCAIYKQEELNVYAHKARDIVRARFTWEAVASRLEKFLIGLAEK